MESDFSVLYSSKLHQGNAELSNKDTELINPTSFYALYSYALRLNLNTNKNNVLENLIQAARSPINEAAPSGISVKRNPYSSGMKALSGKCCSVNQGGRPLTGLLNDAQEDTCKP